MNPIDALFEKLRKENRKAFMPFIAAGDPDLAGTEKLIAKLAKSGADLIEIGFPFSDPVADGPVIQASYTRALNAGVKIDGIFETIRKAKEVVSTPLVGMVSYSIIHRKEPGAFFACCKENGLSGLIIPDLPVEEAEAMADLAKKHQLKLVLLVTPTTTDDRVRKIAAVCTGFLYCVSIVGITGERTELPATVKEYLAKLRSLTRLPLCLGFGVSKPEQMTMLKDHVDGVIVGSALVRLLEKGDLDAVAAYSGLLADALHK